VVIKPTDGKRCAIGKHDGFRRLINPEAQVLLDAGGGTSVQGVCRDNESIVHADGATAMSLFQSYANEHGTESRLTLI
jgi:hypothetical protein